MTATVSYNLDAVVSSGDVEELGDGVTDKDFPCIDGYRLLRVIGQGGMSTVYLAEQVSLDRKVALKVMLPEALADEISRARFENEARIIARLEHPNIVGIHEVGRTGDGHPFYSMPWLSHGHLAQRKLAGDQPKIAAILRNLLQALDYAHVRGVVHRDVKAENVLFDDTDRPMLADFGIAQRRGSNPRLTNAGLAVGSTAYMPPEQARGLEVDRRADIYSLGVLTWEMLVGRLPYNAGDALSMALKHVQEPIPRLPAALKHWQDLIDCAMAKAPEQRYASANEMLVALDALETRTGKAFEAVEVPADYQPPATRAGQTAGLRKRLAIAAVALVAAAAGLAYVFEPHLGSTPQPATQTASPQGPVAPGDALPAPAGDAGQGVLPLVNAVTGHAAPSVDAYIANAEQQLRNGLLLAPPNGNAWDSLDAAWRTNPTHPETQRVTALLFDGLADAAERALREGNTALAATHFQRAQQLDIRRGGSGESVRLLQKRLDAALLQRLNALLAKPDTRKMAAALLADTRWMGRDAAQERALQARIASANDTKTQPSATEVAAQPTPELPAVVTAVTRAEYARFAQATGRAAADCGKGLFGRKRSWNNTGNDRKPVVCVSASDAQAYAAWLGAQDGQHYRLPSAGEARTLGTAASGWLTLCADRECSLRAISGKPQPLDADRGYTDVGILLARKQR